LEYVRWRENLITTAERRRIIAQSMAGKTPTKQGVL